MLEHLPDRNLTTEELAWGGLGEDPDGDREAVPCTFVDVRGETDANLFM